jgi:hypothetical protein
MGTTGGLFCRDCGESLSPDLFKGGCDTRILAEAYCAACLAARSMAVCLNCGGGLRLEDFEEGRAVTLAGRRFCEACLPATVGKDRGEAPPSGGDEPDTEETPTAVGRRHGRYLPGRNAVLAVRARGMGGLFRGDRVRVWLDMSEGGFRAILSGPLDPESRVGGSITCGSNGTTFPFEAVVKYVRAAPRHAGCVLAGCEFVDASADLMAFIRTTLAARPVHLPRAPGPQLA